MTSPRAIAAAVAIALLVGACGGGDDADAGDDAPVDVPVDTTEAPDVDETDETDEADGDAAGPCDLDVDAVAEAAGAEVVDTRDSTGTGSLDGVEYASETCRFEFAEGDVRVAVLATPSGDPFGADGFAELQAASASRTGSDDFPHEDIEGVGSAAFFVGSLLGNQLVVDTGSVVLSIEGDVDGEPLSRDAISAVAAIAVDALG